MLPWSAETFPPITQRTGTPGVNQSGVKRACLTQVPPISGNMVCAELCSARQNQNMMILFVCLEWEKIHVEDEIEGLEESEKGNAPLFHAVGPGYMVLIASAV